MVSVTNTVLVTIGWKEYCWILCYLSYW